MTNEGWWRAIAKFGVGDEETRWAGAWRAHPDAATQAAEWAEQECCGVKPTALWVESMDGERLNGAFMLSG